MSIEADRAEWIPHAGVNVTRGQETSCLTSWNEYPQIGCGRSAAMHAAIAPASLRSASATTAQTLPMATVLPYSRPDTVPRMGTS
jgi:hypothetical protein